MVVNITIANYQIVESGAIIKNQRSRRTGVLRNDIGGVRVDDHEDENYHQE